MHEARDCRSTPRNHHAQRPGPNASKPPASVHRARCAVEIRELPPMNSEKETQLLEFKPVGQMEVMKSGECLDVDAKDKLQLVNGEVGEKCVEVLRDTGCTGVLIKRDLVNQGERTAKRVMLLPLTNLANKSTDRQNSGGHSILRGRSRSIVCPGTSC